MIATDLDEKLEKYTRREIGIDEHGLSNILSDYTGKDIEVSEIKFKHVKRSTGLHMRSAYRLKVSYMEGSMDKQTSLFLKQYVPAGEGEEINGGSGERAYSYRLEKEILQLLDRIGGINPPKLIYDNPDYQVLLMEDLGDILVEDVLRNTDLESKKYYIKRAIDPLVNIHVRATDALPKEQNSAHHSYEQNGLTIIKTPDEDYFTGNLFRYVDSIRKGCSNSTEAIDINNADILRFLDELGDYSDKIGEQLNSIPKRFIHGDYHPGNLVVKDGIVRPTDFKHVIKGPVQFDLVDLLKHPLTSNIDAGDGIDYYFNKIYELNGEKIDRKEFNHLFMYANIYRSLRGPGISFWLERRWPAAFLDLVQKTHQYVSYRSVYIDDAKKIFNKLFH